MTRKVLLERKERARLRRTGKAPAPQYLELREMTATEMVTQLTGASTERQRAILDGREPTPDGFTDWLLGVES